MNIQDSAQLLILSLSALAIAAIGFKTGFQVAKTQAPTLLTAVFATVVMYLCGFSGGAILQMLYLALSR